MSGAEVLDRLLDRTIVLGYSRPGYHLRARHWPDADGLPRLDGRRIAVTGATSGLGEATAQALAGLGAEVALLVRSTERGAEVARSIAGAGPAAGPGAISVHACDLSSLASVRACAAELVADGRPLDGLINNAGVMAPQRTLSADGIELTFATNVVGPFLLTNLLVGALAAAPAGRVVTVSSGGMYGQRIDVGDLQRERDYRAVSAYAASKRAQVILTGLWARRWAPIGVGAHAMHPGWADTPGVRDALPRFHRLTRPLLRTPAEGADTTVWLAGADPAVLGSGGFWHDRRRRPVHLLARTRETEAERAGLWRQLCALSGWREAGSVAGAGSTAVRDRGGVG
ncbi:SDR family NAD(P)-dependent oxidoreductase [Conexibacter sp. DBS9H8]|uniref:SDR family NAD(P)-dependent oxidoreductase n=1 Tax=Conexibacter sp. DBS9H8 TaxID=2937801 RepID=UPI0020104DF1|nr:SDR family NAD(P)-dependent oxidoreductase [Conexibacter sp. DBS9H8]